MSREYRNCRWCGVLKGCGEAEELARFERSGCRTCRPSFGVRPLRRSAWPVVLVDGLEPRWYELLMRDRLAS